VRFDELANLEIELSLLTPMQPAATPMDFDPLADGVHLSIEGRSGVFLPQVARDTGWGKEQLLDRLCTEKMRLPAGSWRVAAARLQTFKTIVVGPEAFDPAE
jgi:AMMECR1 domain-containing protein